MVIHSIQITLRQNFNGTNSYIAVPNYAELNPTQEITLEAWVNPSAIGPSDMAIIGKNFQTSYFLAIHPDRKS